MCIRDSLPCGVISTAVVDENNIDDNKHLPDNEINVAEGDDNGEMVTYLIVTNHTKSDWTINDGNRFYDLIMCNNPINYYYGIMVKDENMNSHYIIKDNICLLYTSRCV